MKDWLISFGKFKEDKDKLLFLGNKTEFKDANTNNIRISSQIGDRGKGFLTLSLSIGLKCRKKWSQVHRLKFLSYQFQRQRTKQ